MITRETIASEFQKIQDEICHGLEQADLRAKFIQDEWAHEIAGGGRTRVITHGNIFEKGGVNFSAVEGPLPSFMQDRVDEKSTSFFATGVSIVMHPISPRVPIIHMNIRYFETDAGDAWFGGGIDLTPIYVDPTQAQFFHRTMKAVCDKYDLSFYPRFKSWADDYFFIRHRAETRGIGGIFFDNLIPDGHLSKEDLFNFVCDVGRSFLQAYLPIVNANMSLPFGDAEKKWQLLRRGRYVEFNLVYDRGTRFGLETAGRIESILMSLPEHASWVYNHQPEEGSPEAKTLLWLRRDVDWNEQHAEMSSL